MRTCTRTVSRGMVVIACAVAMAIAQAPASTSAEEYGKSGWFFVSERATPAMRAAGLRERPDPKQPGRWEPDPDLRAAARKKLADRLKATFAKLASEEATTSMMAARLRAAYETAHQQDISGGRPVDLGVAESAALRPLLLASPRRMPADLPLERPALFAYPALPGTRALVNGAVVLRLIQAMQTDLIKSAPSFGPRMSTARFQLEPTLGPALG